MNTPDIELLAQAIEKHQTEKPQDRTFKLLSCHGETVWVKTPSEPRLRMLYSVTNQLMVWLGMPYFQAPPHAGAPGGKASLKIESSMLHRLKAAGVPVPEVIASTENWLALNSVGEVNLDVELKNLHGDQRFDLWKKSVRAIAEVHAHKSCLSQCFSRNIMLKNQKPLSEDQEHFYSFYFLDFEEDPTQIMSLAQAQARDWALFLHSTASLISNEKDQAQEFLLGILSQENKCTQKAVELIFRKLRVLRYFKSMQWLGKDSIRIYHLGEFASGIFDQLKNCPSPHNKYY